MEKCLEIPKNFWKKWEIIKKPGCNIMGYVITSVKIDEDKRQLAKQKGIKLQDLLDDALDMALQLEVEGKAQLVNEKEQILKDLEFIDKQTEEYLAKQDAKRNELNIRLQFIDKALEQKAVEEDNLEQQREYNHFVEIAKKEGAFDSIEEDLKDHSLRYDIDLNELVEQLSKDAFNM